MIAGIITVAGREHLLNPLVEVIKPSVDELRIFTDTERRGNWFNMNRCMDEMLNLAKQDEPVLITCDDVITVKDWRMRWEEIHSRAKDNIYVMMSRQKHMFTIPNIRRGYVTRCQPRGFYDHAIIYINQRRFLDNVLTWFETIGKDLETVKKRTNHFDVVMQEYMVYQGVRWTTTVPTLFNNIGDVSTLGHNIGGSPMYIGDCL